MDVKERIDRSEKLLYEMYKSLEKLAPDTKEYLMLSSQAAKLLDVIVKDSGGVYDIEANAKRIEAEYAKMEHETHLENLRAQHEMELAQIRIAHEKEIQEQTKFLEQLRIQNEQFLAESRAKHEMELAQVESERSAKSARAGAIGIVLGAVVTGGFQALTTWWKVADMRAERTALNQRFLRATKFEDERPIGTLTDRTTVQDALSSKKSMW